MVLSMPLARTGAGPPQAGPQAMCVRLNAARIAVPSGDRPDSLAFSDARMGEGLTIRYILKFSPRYTLRTSALATISSGVPSASTAPSLMM